MGLFKGQKPKKLKAPNIEKLKSRHDIEGLVKALIITRLLLMIPKIHVLLRLLRQRR